MPSCLLPRNMIISITTSSASLRQCPMLWFTSYHISFTVLDVENGHTLHLVERQPAQSQPSSDPRTGETSGNNTNRGIDMYCGAYLVYEIHCILLKA